MFFFFQIFRKNSINSINTNQLIFSSYIVWIENFTVHNLCTTRKYPTRPYNLLYLPIKTIPINYEPISIQMNCLNFVDRSRPMHSYFKECSTLQGMRSNDVDCAAVQSKLNFQRIAAKITWFFRAVECKCVHLILIFQCFDFDVTRR